MSDNIARKNTGMAYYEATFISLDVSDTVFMEAQLSGHVDLTNVFSSISLTRANDSQTVFHDVEPATHENRNFEFLETSNFETVFSATGMFANVSIPNVVFAAGVVLTCEQITTCLRLSSLYIDTPFVYFGNVAVMVTEELFTSDSRRENEHYFTQVRITNVATVFSEDQIIRHEEIASVFYISID